MGSITSTTDNSGYYREALRDAETEFRRELNQNRKNHEKQIEKFEKNSMEELNRQEKKMDETIQRVKKDSYEASDREKENYGKALDEWKDQLYNSQGRLSKTIPLSEHEERMASLNEDLQKTREMDQRKFEDRDNELFQRMSESERRNEQKLQRVVEDTRKNASENHARSKAFFLEEKKDLKDREAKAEAALQDREVQSRDQFRRLADGDQHEIERLKQINQNQDAINEARNRDISRARESHYTDLLQRQTKDHLLTEKDVENTYKNQIDRIQKQHHLSDQRAQSSEEALLVALNEKQQGDLEAQSTAYKDTMARMRHNSQEEINRLQDQLRKIRNPQNSADIPPASEFAIRKNLVKEYEKKLNAEIDRRKNLTDQLEQNREDTVQKLNGDFSDKEARINQTANRALSEERTAYFDLLQDTEDHFKEQARNMSTDHDHEVDVLTRQFNNALERQKQSYERLLTTNRTESADQIALLREELNFNQRVAQKTLNDNQNELIREYGKKLADQKAEYDFKIDELKAQAQADLRDLERRNKQELESQARGYEKRLAQLESQNKERERNIIQNYQTELDRTRRSYELSNQKKS